MTSRVSFFDVVIRPLCFFCASGWVPATFSATPMKTDGIYATTIQTARVSATPMQLGGLSALMRTISVIGFSLLQSTFSSSVLQKMSNPPAPRPDLRLIKTTLRPNQKKSHTIQKSLPSSWFGYDKIIKLPCNQS